ncbi:hypothetical protein F1737_09440 [Methanoplanus sp. FWC-SCC4]|uniref:Uncharacterized protein n=1 Tax=Methanochimaera problematica TaxID=2609417 RepID=A0AA97FEN2_9EURY|nr:hypothetical protein [Methanoplanus sp. FWC-SCC4]WOF16893.1 hypothetical protein F1737_09440 [Methanoplanus sp. FWC-SCC4]
MRITITIDDELGAEIDASAASLGLKRVEWIRVACAEYLTAMAGNKAPDSKPETKTTLEISEDNSDILSGKDEEISRLKDEIEMERELRNAYSRLIDEKDGRIDDLKEEISRIEALSITAADNIASSKDERITDLNNMIDHLQAQAAAHSVALQSAVRTPALEEKKEDEEAEEKSGVELIEKPKWMFWK